MSCCHVGSGGLPHDGQHASAGSRRARDPLACFQAAPFTLFVEPEGYDALIARMVRLACTEKKSSKRKPPSRSGRKSSVRSIPTGGRGQSNPERGNCD